MTMFDVAEGEDVFQMRVKTSTYALVLWLPLADVDALTACIGTPVTGLPIRVSTCAVGGTRTVASVIGGPGIQLKSSLPAELYNPALDGDGEGHGCRHN